MIRGKDSKGNYYQHSKGARKYYYEVGNDRSRNIAKGKASKAVKKGGLGVRHRGGKLKYTCTVSNYLLPQIAINRFEFEELFRGYNEAAKHDGNKPIHWSSRVTPEVRKVLKAQLINPMLGL
jgi:hypothetical protein